MEKRLILTIFFLAIILSLGVNAADSRYFTYNPEVLGKVRSSIANNDILYKKAYDELLINADNALTHNSYSVTQKSLTPPSGSKHDYYSFGPYWWPNPDTATHLPYIRMDGKINPDSKTDATDSLRMVHFANDMRVLGLAYYFSGKPEYASKAAELARVWFVAPATRMTPNMIHAQAIPGVVDGRGIGIIDSRVLIDVMDSIELIRPANTLQEVDYQAIKAWYKQFTQWLLTSDNGFEEGNWYNNHGAFYDAQVVAFSLFSDQPQQAKQQMKIAFLRHLVAQIDPKGVLTAETDRTRSWHYTHFALSAFVRLARYGELTGVDLWHASLDDRSLQQALLLVANQVNNTTPWPYPELKFDESEAIGNILAAANVYKTPLLQQKADYLQQHYPGNINLLTVTASLVP